MADSGKKKMLTPEEAQQIIFAEKQVSPEVERLPLAEARGRVLAEDIVSPIPVPPADNSAMDGYAVRSADIDPDRDTGLEVSQRIPAGTAPEPLLPGTAARIFTGAPMPAGADAVVMQEHCQVQGNRVLLPCGVECGRNVRLQGGEIKPGARVLDRGTRLRAQELGLLATVGIGTVSVFKRLKVAVLNTGSELIEPGQPLTPGHIYSSNSITLHSLIESLGLEVVNGGTVSDSLEGTCERLQSLADKADCVITTGGVSVGEEDYVRLAVEQLGTLKLWRLAMKPGKPLAFGRIKGKKNSTVFFGLPGNPVSVFVTFLLFARPWLIREQGMLAGAPIKLSLPSDFDFKAGPHRREYLRVRVENDENGATRVVKFPSQDSSMLSSMSWANALAVIYPDKSINCGGPVEVLLLPELL